MTGAKGEARHDRTYEWLDAPASARGIGIGRAGGFGRSTAAAGRAARAAASPLAAQSGSTVYFRGWQYHPEIVQDNVDRYNKELNGKVDYATVTGDYPSLMEKNLIAKADLDILYANPSFCGALLRRRLAEHAGPAARTARRSSMRCIRTSAMPGPTRASCLA